MSDQLSKELMPLWSGDRVYRETVMFIGKNDSAPLLYVPTKIERVTSYDGSILYLEGEDFTCDGEGVLTLTEHTRIPYIEEAAYYHNDPSSLISIPYRGKETYIYWGEGTTMTRWQIAVTYTHNSALIEPPLCHAGRFENFLGKMARGEDVTVFFYGDSITAGGNSSYACETPPYLAPWTMLSTEYLARKYGYTERFIATGLARTQMVPAEDLVCGTNGTLTYVNTAVPGWSSAHGVDNLTERVSDPIAQYGCDLFVLAFGMNDKRLTVEEHVINLQRIVDGALAAAPNAAVLLVTPMWPNPAATARWCINQPSFEPAVAEMAEEYTARGIPCAVVPMTTVSGRVLSRKRFCDYSGNNINHPNDFMMRLYAQTTLFALFGE